MTEDHLWGVILAGGIGSRFWPASTPRRPKQLLNLATEKPLIVDTVERIEPLIPTERLRILTGSRLAEVIGGALPGFGERNFFREPRAAGTAPVLVWAATLLAQEDPEAVMISLHADHVINPPQAFRNQILATAELARTHRRLFTIGVQPDRPETGYGYINRGASLEGAHEAYAVERFVEKPDAATAQEYLNEGTYLWNTGLFVWRVADLLDEIRRHTPEIADLLPLLDDGQHEEFFRQVPSLSIDEGLLERSDRVGVVPSAFRWDDIGAWDAVYRTNELDPQGNAIIGEGFPVDSRGCAMYTDDGPVVTFGVDDLIVVRTNGVTFVTHRDRTADLKTMLSDLPENLRTLE